MKKQKLNNNYIKDYNNGLTIWQLVEKYHDTYKNISEAISGHRFEARLLPDNEKSRIIQMYNDGLSTVKIGKIYGVNNKSIAVVLEENGISRNQKRFVRKYTINESFFDNIDTQDKAYCLGFLAADGCNFPKKGTISMSLEECDKNILEKMCTVMNNQHPLEYIDYSNKHDFGYTYKNQYRMLIFSSHMCNSLIDKGIIPSKSNSLKFPYFLTEELLPHYIRGLSDGDGSLGYKNKENFISKGEKKLNYSLTSTIYMCNGIAEYLYKNMDIIPKIIEASNHNGYTYSLYITKQNDIITFLNWLYQDCNLYLQRKYDLYQYYLSVA